MKSKLLVEKLIDGEISNKEIPVRFPHCDPRILHKSEECEFCKDATFLQEERERLNVSNTDHANRAWPCPANKARSSKIMNEWRGNRAKTKEDLEKEDKEWEMIKIAVMSELVDEEDSKSSA